MRTVFFLYLLFLFPKLPSFCSSDDLTAFVYSGCSPLKYDNDSSYAFNVDSVFFSLTNTAGFSFYSNFTSDPVNGFFQCRGDISLKSCNSCVRSALAQLASICSAAVGAVLQLSGCFLRYGNDTFVGVPDTTLVLKKCGGAASNRNVLGQLDGAFAQLQAALPTATYRAASSGNVQAMAQCDGDLSPKDCASCIDVALGQLQTACGVSLSGDVYLGKCYGRYWSDGVEDTNSSPGTSSSNGNGDASKTWAITIGILAAVLFLIVFLSFIIRQGSTGKS